METNAPASAATTDADSESSERVDRNALRDDIRNHLETIGLNGARGEALSKDDIRAIHRFHREAARERILRALGKKAARFLEYIANGDEVSPREIRPELVEAKSGTRDGDLFRFATLIWSVPASQGYGRRLRYLVMDKANGKLIGVFALGDPVFNLRARDNWIKWNQAERRERLVNVMDAYVVGAVPPYSALLGGKTVASLMASQEVSDMFEQRYGDSPGVISGKRKGARLAMVTVMSALGRSSIYNRLKLTDPETGETAVRLIRLGKTLGFGHFQIPNGLFSQLRQVLREDGHEYANGYKFGGGPNWRVRAAREALKSLGLDADDIMRHGIEREVYAMPIAQNAREFLAGEDAEPRFHHRTAAEISALARSRWVVPRSERDAGFRQFRREELAAAFQLGVAQSATARRLLG